MSHISISSATEDLLKQARDVIAWQLSLDAKSSRIRAAVIEDLDKIHTELSRCMAASIQLEQRINDHAVCMNAHTGAKRRRTAASSDSLNSSSADAARDGDEDEDDSQTEISLQKLDVMFQ